MWKTLNLLKFNSNDHWNVLTCPVFDEFKFSNWTQISCWTLNNYFFSFQNCNTPSFSCLNAADTAFVSLGRHCSTSNITLGSKGETGDRQTQSFRGCSPMTQYRWLTHRRCCVQEQVRKAKSCWQQGIKFTKIPPSRKFLIAMIVHIYVWTVKLVLSLRPLRSSLIMHQASKYEARVN